MENEKYLGKWKIEPDGKRTFSPSRDLGRLRVELLTKEIAEKLGHIAWIEEADPIIALRRMQEALQKPPVNCVVWANAAGGKDQWRGDVAAWRAENEARFLSGETNGNVQDHFTRTFASAASAAKELRQQFNAAAARQSNIAAARPAPGLQHHMKERFGQLFEALPGHKLRFQLRAGAKDTTTPYVTDHIDGGELKDLRFLECLSGPGTYLFANADAIRERSAFDENQMDLVLPRKGNFTVYEAPPGCLILLSNQNLPWQPILHGEPFLPADKTPQRRTVTTYDFRKVP